MSEASSGLSFRQSVEHMVNHAIEIDGKAEMFTGWRAVHSDHRLPSKGGIRYAPNADQDEMEVRQNNPKVKHYRMAACVVAVQNISRSYRDIGY